MAKIRIISEASSRPLELSEVKDIIDFGTHVERQALYKDKELSQETIRYAIETGKELGDLYIYQTLDQESIETAIKHGHSVYLGWLYDSQKLNDNNVKLAILRGEYLQILVVYQKFSDENAKLYIERAERESDLGRLYLNQKLSVENIKRALLRHSEFGQGYEKMLDELIYNSQISKLSSSKREEIEEFMAMRNL